MNDTPTPETDALEQKQSSEGCPQWNDMMRWVREHASLARKLERERDEAQESLKHIAEYGTEEINAAVELRQKLASALVERDEWAAMCGRYKQERDIAEQDATNYHARIIELIDERDKTKRERDEAREKAERYRIEANAMMMQRDEARSDLSLKQQTLTIAEGTLSDLRKQRDEWSAMCGRYKQERDEAREALMKIEEVFIDSDDTYEDLIKMGNIARAALGSKT